MRTNIEILNELRSSTFIDEDGEEYKLEFGEGLTEAEIEALSKSFPNGRIADELLEILRKTKGWDGYGLDGVYFDSIGQFGLEELSPNSLTLGHDGLGNFWILDLDKNGKPGKVFFACHDPAVLVIHSQNLNEYLHQVLEFYQSPNKCYLNEIHNDAVMSIWDKDNFCSPKTEFVAQNAEFEGFLANFTGDKWTVADLRRGKNRDGFAWGRSGPDLLVARHPTKLIWVMKNKRKGFFSRLFGG